MQTRFHIRRKVFALFLCVILSIFLWLLNDLNTLQTSSVQIPVKFSGLPYDMVTTNTLPSHMDATVEATGFNLLWRQLVKEKKVVEIPLRLENGMVSADRNYLFNINYYMDDITDALGSHVKIKRIFPDTFSIRFAKKFSKKVPVEFVSELSFENEFDVSAPVIIKPDSVYIYGTQENVKSIRKVSTQKLSLDKISRSFRNQLPLENINGISYNKNEVDIQVSVEQFTQKEITMPITSSNVPTHFELNTIPNMATIKVLVPVSSFETISASSFKVDARFPEDINSVRRIILAVSSKPEYVKVVSISPESVEYKVKQNAK